jgi:formamidopyrimidine-DNA glycosylase
MPELPEVETVRRWLTPFAIGRTIEAIGAWRPSVVVPSVAELARLTMGQRILEVGRRGKQLFCSLENGAFLLIHLGMTGWLVVENEALGEPLGADGHARAWLRLDRGQYLIFHDVRTFGRIGAAPDDAFLTKLAPDPLEPSFDGAKLVQRLARRTVPLKQALLDQHLVSGIGSIYADEGCYAACVDPLARPCDLPRDQIEAVIQELRPVLLRAVAAGGTSFDGPYLTPLGPKGAYRPAVYGAAGEPCPRACGAIIQKAKLGRAPRARPVYFCPKCQGGAKGTSFPEVPPAPARKVAEEPAAWDSSKPAPARPPVK